MCVFVNISMCVFQKEWTYDKVVECKYLLKENNSCGNQQLNAPKAVQPDGHKYRHNIQTNIYTLNNNTHTHRHSVIHPTSFGKKISKERKKDTCQRQTKTTYKQKKPTNRR